MKSTTKILTALVLSAALAGGSFAANLVGKAAFASSSFGQQSDASTPPAYIQTFVAPSGAIVEAIRWWGFHGANSLGAGSDNFLVSLGGVAQTGLLTVTSVSPFFDQYTLDIPDAALTASSLSIINDSLDVEWFWQSASAVGNPNAPDAAAVSFSLIGRIGSLAVPEPSMPLIVIAALMAATFARSRIQRVKLSDLEAVEP